MNEQTLILGDCMKVLPTLDAGIAECVVTDIPFGEVMRKVNPSANNPLRQLSVDRTEADRIEFELPDFVAELLRVCRGSFYVFCGLEQISPLVKAFRKGKATVRLGAWEKTNPQPSNGSYLWLSGLEFCVFARKRGAVFNEYCQKALWRHPTGRAKRFPTEKPEPLTRRLIEASSNPGDLILDPCMGSGTTGESCAATKRRFYGIENKEAAFAIAERRLRGASALTP